MKVSNEGTFECPSVADAVDGQVASGLVASFYQLIEQYVTILLQVLLHTVHNNQRESTVASSLVASFSGYILSVLVTY